MADADRDRIGCRFCSYATPLWLGRSCGWPRLVDHILTTHPDVHIDAALAAFGMNDEGAALTRAE